jgi:hypothetical protein
MYSVHPQKINKILTISIDTDPKITYFLEHRIIQNDVILKGEKIRFKNLLPINSFQLVPWKIYLLSV